LFFENRGDGYPSPFFIAGTEGEMRLDKYLKVSRIIKRRTVANDACDAEHVNVNGRRAKASYDVKIGDILEITFGQRTLKLRVKEVKDTVAKADASSMYEIIEE
jgi:ribosomal 50S subunit-recycling heat shock protein